jgi:predicted RNA-binding protein with PUA-like domain
MAPRKPVVLKKKIVTKKQVVARKASKTAKPKAAPLVPATTRAPGERRYWLVKTEPEVFSFNDLMKMPGATTHWDGVRNYQARNFLRDSMKLGDGVLIYHSNAEPPAIVGLAEVSREGYPDHTQFEAKHVHFDPDAKTENPSWFMVDVRAVQPLARPLPLPELRTIKDLERMTLLQKGSRLSVQPVAAEEWELVRKLGGA